MDGQPIRLKYGESETFSPGGGITGVEITKISAKAKNIAFIKEVALLYQQPNGTWTEKLLAWNQNFGDYDLFSLDDNTFDTTAFVLRYSTAGQIFWDNNNGALKKQSLWIVHKGASCSPNSLARLFRLRRSRSLYFVS